MVNTSLDEQVKSKTRFYFDGDNIVYIKTITLVKLVSQNVDIKIIQKIFMNKIFKNKYSKIKLSN